jgi:hypothetical protein
MKTEEFQNRRIIIKTEEFQNRRIFLFAKLVARGTFTYNPGKVSAQILTFPLFTSFEMLH